MKLSSCLEQLNNYFVSIYCLHSNTSAPSVQTPNKHRFTARHKYSLGHRVKVCCKQFYFTSLGVKQFTNMSDDGSTTVEKKGRGRPKANGTQSEAKVDTKKRGRPPAAVKTKESAKSSDDEQAPVAKRGRGRPKGSKKKAAAKGKSAPVEGRGRGRPRKDPAPPKKDAASSEEEQDEDDDDEGSEEQ